jgi:four helix bundle protein
MKNNILIEKSYDFAVKIVALYQQIFETKNEFVLVRQLLKCGTSIGANVAEANGAISKAEFSAKISIAYKECLETKYWLSLLKDTGYISAENHESLFAAADELGKILFSIIKTTRIENQ